MKRFKDVKASLGCFVFVLFAYLFFTELQVYYVCKVNNSVKELMYYSAVEKAKLNFENKHLHDQIIVQKAQFQNILKKENEAFVNIIILFKNQMECLMKENQEMEEYIEKHKDRHSASFKLEMLRYDV